jgi:MtN3 and saliva related transmembrane protein
MRRARAGQLELGVAAAVWGVVMALSPEMQIRRMIRLGSSRDVSIGYLLVIVVGFAVWIAYGIAIGNPALVVPNALALIVGVGTIAVAFSLRKPRERRPTHHEASWRS